jgi:hypothetical protein
MGHEGPFAITQGRHPLERGIQEKYLLYFNKLLGPRLALCALGTPGREYNKVCSCQWGKC